MDLHLRIGCAKLITFIAYLAVCFMDFSISESVVGKDCKVFQAPVNAHEFDLNSLHRQHDLVVVSDSGMQFLINICGSLAKKCNGQTNASVCLIKNDKFGKKTELVVGYTNNSVIYDNGKLQIELKGDKCENGKDASVTIIMMCDHSGDQGPELIPAFYSNCTFLFVWHNNASCTPRRLIDCIAKDESGISYDLSHLTLPATNYVAIKKDNRGGPLVKILLNVCQSVVMVEDFACNYNSGACARSVAVNDTVKHNLGEVTNGPFFENGVLKLKYENGDACRQDLNTSTIIKFLCNKKQDETNPKFHRLSNNCEYHFLWKTSAACPPQSWSSASLPSQPVQHSLVAGDCNAFSPITGDRIDLRSLRGQEFELTLKEGRTLKLSVCGPLSNSTCGGNVGACIQRPEHNESLTVGLDNSNVEFQDSQPYVFYSNGSHCTDQETWSTQIIFECDTKFVEGPKSFFNYGCKYIVFWYTQAACEREVPCFATTVDQVVDLSYFSRKTDNYHINMGNNNITLNICHQIIPSSGISCPHRSGACVVVDNKPLSLGYFVSPPILVGGVTELRYVNGSQCPAQNNTKLSSVFRFTCNSTAGIGRPTFRDIANNGCEYVFDWRTNVVCEEEEEELSITTNGCVIRDRTSRTTTDLTLLHQDGGYRVSDKLGRNYSVNLCGTNDTCDGVAVCEELPDAWTSYGQLVSVVHDFSENLTRMFYAKGAPCDATGKLFRSAEIWLRCDESDQGKPIVVESDTCFVLFEWTTHAACGQITEMTDGEDKQKSGGEARNHRMGLRFGIIAVSLLCVGAMFVLWVSGACRKCARLRHHFARRRGPGNNVSYSRQIGNEDDFCMEDDD